MEQNAVRYVVGEERSLEEILAGTDVKPLLDWGVRAGAAKVLICDPYGGNIWSTVGEAADGGKTVKLPIVLEGEQVGELALTAAKGGEELATGLAGLIRHALDAIIVSSLKRMLTTEIHSHLVDLSYEELLESNRRLSESEGRYRQLAAELEVKVEERTRELQHAHVRLLQQEKMVSIGQLAAGMAHEINNPLGFIISNLRTLKKYTSRMTDMLNLYRTFLRGDRAGMEEAASYCGGKWQELKLDTICADLDGLLNQSLEGAERVRKLVADLKGFSHIDDGEISVVNINNEIDRTLGILGHAVPPGTNIIKLYAPLPGFQCNPALLCQVFLNIIQNALQCRRSGLQLTIATSCADSQIKIRFSDNGPGIPEEIRGRIFEPFFSTREVGAGTGMGLAVVYDVVAGYGGSVEVDCPSGQGARFTVNLPLREDMNQGR